MYNNRAELNVYSIQYNEMLLWNYTKRAQSAKRTISIQSRLLFAGYID